MFQTKATLIDRDRYCVGATAPLPTLSYLAAVAFVVAGSHSRGFGRDLGGELVVLKQPVQLTLAR